MATQSEVQQLIQGLTPSGVNNGNPNTVYNNSPGYVPPSSNAFDAWRLSNVRLPPATPTVVGDPIARANQFFQNAVPAELPASLAGAWTPPEGATLKMPRLVFPNFSGGGGGGYTPTPPAVEPPLGGPTPPIDTGGELPPISTGGNTPPLGGGGGTSPPASIGGSTNTTLPGNNLNNMPPLGSFQGGINTGGNGGSTEMPSWQQILDMAGDAFGLPGNWYLSNTGQWDVSNILEGLGDYATGGLASLGIDALTQMYTDPQTGMFRDNAPAWLQDHLLDNVMNESTGLLNQWNAATDARTNELISKQTESILNKYGMTNAPAFGNATQAIRGGMSAADAARTFGAQNVQGAISQNPYSVNVGTRLAAGVGKGGAGVITGDAAREMFAAMKAGQMGVKQTGGDIYGRLYER